MCVCVHDTHLCKHVVIVCDNGRLQYLRFCLLECMLIGVLSRVICTEQ